MKTGVLLVQLGSPKSPAVEDVREFLKDFLSDPRLIKQNIFWKLLLNLVILPKRKKTSAEAYEEIWKDNSFPLHRYSDSFEEKVQGLSKEDIQVELAYIIGKEPLVKDKVEKLKGLGVETIVIVPLFPQFSEATTLSVEDNVKHALEQMPGYEPKIKLVKSFHRVPFYIQALAKTIGKHLEEHKPEKLILSFHGYPKARIFNGDPYFCHCVETALLVSDSLNYPKEQMIISFQSQFGRDEWLEPSTENTIIMLAKDGVKNIAVVCPAFTVDNLETLEEIDIGLREVFKENGGEHFSTVPCLNDDEVWCKDFADYIGDLVEDKDIESMPLVQEFKCPSSHLKEKPFDCETCTMCEEK